MADKFSDLQDSAGESNPAVPSDDDIAAWLGRPSPATVSKPPAEMVVTVATTSAAVEPEEPAAISAAAANSLDEPSILQLIGAVVGFVVMFVGSIVLLQIVPIRLFVAGIVFGAIGSVASIILLIRAIALGTIRGNRLLLRRR